MAEDIAHWLEGLGLSQYAEVFAENRIDFDILSDLSESDLEKLDIPLGDRKRLLRALSNLSDDLDAGEAVAVERASLAPAEAERHQLTVMFCDLVGSTAKPKRTTSAPSTSPVPNPPSPGNSAPRPAWPTCGTAKAKPPRPATCSPRSTPGSPRGLIRLI